MSLNSDLAGRDVFMKYTTAEGQTYVSVHRCWNADLFEASRRSDASKDALEHGKKTGKPGLNKAERITAEQFNSERNLK